MSDACGASHEASGSVFFCTRPTAHLGIHIAADVLGRPVCQWAAITIRSGLLCTRV